MCSFSSLRAERASFSSEAEIGFEEPKRCIEFNMRLGIETGRKAAYRVVLSLEIGWGAGGCRGWEQEGSEGMVYKRRMTSYMCVFHRTKFNSLDHKPVILCKCLHLQCEEFLRSSLQTNGDYKCLEDSIQYFENDSEKIENEVATKVKLKEIEGLEVRCDFHYERIAEVFCSRELKVFCEECKHADADCCTEPSEGLDFEIRHRLRQVCESADLPASSRLQVRNLVGTPAQDQYLLYRRVITGEAREHSLWCSQHKITLAVSLHKNTLKLGCDKCVTVESENYIGTQSQNTEMLVAAIQKYLRKVDCFALEFPLLKEISQKHTLPWDKLLSLAVKVGEKEGQEGTFIPVEMHCPKCVRVCERLVQLNCRDAKHGICEVCKSRSGEIVCPLDGNMFVSYSDLFITGEKTTSAAPSEPSCPPILPREEDKLEEDFSEESNSPFVTEKVRQNPHWRGTRIPPPTLAGSDFHVLNRFFAIYPPMNIPESDQAGSMKAWVVNQDISQVEAVTVTVSTSITLTGITVACPVDKRVRMTIDQLQVLKGDSLDSPAHVSPLAEPLEVYGGKLVVDVRFTKVAQLEAFEKYTIMMRLRGNVRGVMEVYKGNQITASEFLNSEGVDLWVFDEPIARGKTTNGDNSKSGPILRLFYK